MCQAVEECRCHFGIAEHRRPFTEGEVCGDDDRGALVEPADQVEEELATGYCKLIGLWSKDGGRYGIRLP